MLFCKALSWKSLLIKAFAKWKHLNVHLQWTCLTINVLTYNQGGFPNSKLEVWCDFIPHKYFLIIQNIFSKWIHAQASIPGVVKHCTHCYYNLLINRCFPYNLWQTLLSQIGGKYVSSLLRLPYLPQAAVLNCENTKNPSLFKCQTRISQYPVARLHV